MRYGYVRVSTVHQDTARQEVLMKELGVGFVSKKEALDTSTPMGRMLLTVIAGLNQFEREVMLERQRESIAAMPVVDGKKVSARTGRGFGRPKAEVDRIELDALARKQRSGELTVKECCERLGIGRTTWYALVG